MRCADARALRVGKDSGPPERNRAPGGPGLCRLDRDCFTAISLAASGPL
jgi:hypothetical protein